MSYSVALTIVSASLRLFSSSFHSEYLEIARYYLHISNENMPENNSQIISK